MSIVTLGFGAANYPSIRMTTGNMRVRPPFIRESAVTSGKPSGIGMYTLAGRVSAFGSWSSRPVEHPEGTIILLQSGWKRAGAPLRDGAIFIRLRDGAPEYKIHSKVPLCAENACGDRLLAFHGRGDILSPDELIMYSIEANSSYRNKFMQADEIDECFIIEITAAETAPRPALKAVIVDGERKVIETAVAAPRRLTFRRRG